MTEKTEETAASGLEDLFDEPVAPDPDQSQSASETTAAASGLEDLFDEPVAPDPDQSQSASETTAAASGLEDLFDEPGESKKSEPASAKAAEAAPQGTPNAEDPAKDVRKKPAKNTRKASSKGSKGTKRTPKASAPVRKNTTAPDQNGVVFFRTATGFSEKQPEKARTRPSGRSAVGRIGTERVVENATASDYERDRWRERMSRLWPSVEQLLRIAGSATALDPVRARMVLTQDAGVDKAQRDELITALRPEVALAGANDLFRSREDVSPVTAFFYDEMLGISVLGDLWRDPTVTEIMVDRWDRIVVEREGKLHLTERSFMSAEHASSIARALALRVSDRAVSNSIPLVSAELPNARVSIAYGPVVEGGLAITIRKFRDIMGLEDLKKVNALDGEMLDFLATAVRARASILISGGTGSGKTTIINLLSQFVPDNERVITIEDAFELNLSNTHVVSMQTKEAASADDSVSVTLADLLRSTLRMRPDRIIVGEIREPEAAEVMLAAANTGHAGTMTTLHANSPESALNERLHDLLLQRRPGNSGSVARTIASAFDLVVQVKRARDGSRYISHISAVDPQVEGDMVRVQDLYTGHGDRNEREFHAHLPANPRVIRRVQDILGWELGANWDD